MRVYKYPMESYEVTIEMPRGAKVLSARIQGPPYNNEREGIVLWALVDPTNPTEPRRFVAVNTGPLLVGNDRRFIDTCEATTGIIWHVFEEKNP